MQDEDSGLNLIDKEESCLEERRLILGIRYFFSPVEADMEVVSSRQPSSQFS